MVKLELAQMGQFAVVRNLKKFSYTGTSVWIHNKKRDGLSWLD